MSYIRLLRSEEHFDAIFGAEGLASAKEEILIATANLKMTMIPGLDGVYQSTARLFRDMLDRGIRIRILCSSVSGDVEKRTGFAGALMDEKLLEEKHFFLYSLRRNHSKVFVFDKRVGIFSSANLTGAGVGAKAAERRNYEFGAMTDHPVLVAEMVRHVEKAMEEAQQILTIEDMIAYRKMAAGETEEEGENNETN